MRDIKVRRDVGREVAQGQKSQLIQAKNVPELITKVVKLRWKGTLKEQVII